MNRRKGVPCGCDADPCGCSPKNHCVKAINNASPDPNGDFTITKGDNIEITEISNGIEIGMKNPLTDDLNIQADLTVDGDIIANGDIIQNGSSYETHAEKVYTNDDYIVMRDGAVGALAADDYSGFQVKKYDGMNDGRLVIDRDGTARVGDVGDEQPLATRDESADLTDGHLVKWDAANLKLTDAGAGVDDLGMKFLAKGNVNVYVGTPYDLQSVTINLPSPAVFTSDYDYMVTANVLNANDFSVVHDVTISLPNNTVTTPGTSFNIGVITGDDIVVYWYVYRMKKNHTGLPNMFGCFPASLDTQPKLISGTNIKTVGGQSLLGSGNVPAGGLSWTERTANDDWSDMFEKVGSYIRVKKHLFITASSLMQYLPKGFEPHFTSIYIPWRQLGLTGTNTINTVMYLEIKASAIPSSQSNVTISKHQYAFTTDGSTVTITRTVTSDITSKSQFKIWVAD